VNRFPLALLALLLAACGDDAPATSPAAPQAPDAAAAKAAYLLPQDITGTIPVIEALKGAEGAEVAIVGRVQKKVKGRALFYLTDESIPDCLHCGMKTPCKTPWDYCCHAKEMKAGTIVVELRDATGEPARVENLGLRELDLVAVKGKLAKGAGDRMVLLAQDGWFVRDRPEFPKGVKIPD
jgi:hypothetical protein